MKLFLDTNVLIDFILQRQPFYSAAAMIVSYAIDGKVEACVSSMSIVTAKFICVDRCKMPLDIFRKKIDFLRDVIYVCSVDATDVYNSHDAKWRDFEDGVQYFSAMRWGADYVVTRNVVDFEGNKILVMSSDDTCQLLRNVCTVR